MPKPFKFFSAIVRVGGKLVAIREDGYPLDVTVSAMGFVMPKRETTVKLPAWLRWIEANPFNPATVIEVAKHNDLDDRRRPPKPGSMKLLPRF